MLAEAEEWQKHVIVILDEMHVCEDIMYDKHTGALIGSANLGDINHHLCGVTSIQLCAMSIAYPST